MLTALTFRSCEYFDLLKQGKVWPLNVLLFGLAFSLLLGFSPLLAQSQDVLTHMGP